MSESVIVACPHCGARLKLKDRANLGVTRPCMRCREPFVLQPEDELTASIGGDRGGVATMPAPPRTSAGALATRLETIRANKPAMIGVVVATFFLMSFLVFVFYPWGDEPAGIDNAGDQPAAAETNDATSEVAGQNDADPFGEAATKPALPVGESKPAEPMPQPAKPPSEQVASLPKQFSEPPPPISRNDPRQTEPKPASPQQRENKPEPPTRTPAPNAFAGNNSWPQWRGPNRDGISQETGLLKSWPADGPPLLWRVRGLGRGYSSVAIANGRIFTMGRVNGETQLICLSDADGSQQWSTRVGGGDDPNCTPTVDVDAGLVFGLSHAGDLLCADASSGDELWRKNFGRDFGGRMMSNWGYSESPLVDGDNLICTPGSNRAMLAALEKRTGRSVWQTSISNTGNAGKDGAGYSSIVISQVGRTKQYVQLVGRGVVGVSAANGQLLWGYNRIANRTANVPTPVIKDNYIFCSSGYNDGGSALLQLSSSGRDVQARELYYKSSGELQNHHGGMVLVGDHVYFGEGHNNGFPACVELTSGRNVWGRQRGTGRGSAGVVYADGHLYFRYEDGVMALIEATPSRYNLVSSFQEPTGNGKAWAHPVICNGRLYLRDQDELLCYDIRER